MRKLNTFEKGFTLLEMLIAIVIVTIGVIAVFSATTKYTEQTQQEKESLISSYLCQEGIEIVKNIRDTNWVSGVAWNTGLTSCASGCEADYTSNNLTPWSDQGRNLYIVGSGSYEGLYQYIVSPQSSDLMTQYRRNITITQASSDELDIQVDVFWKSYTTTIKENIYNWKQ